VGYRAIGLDRAWPLLRFGQGRRPSVPLFFADMRHLPLRTARLDGIWAAASLIHLPKMEVGHVLAELRRRLKAGGLFAATLTYGTRSRVHKRCWMPGRYFARWRKDELAGLLRRAGWEILTLRVVTNQERKGRWINVIARRP
jgi:SAM-dependent methyltransferase